MCFILCTRPSVLLCIPVRFMHNAYTPARRRFRQYIESLQRQWLGDNGEIVVELPRKDGEVGDDGDNDDGGGDGESSATGRGKGKEKAKARRFTAVSGGIGV